MFFD
jgi:hypothetical protein